MRLDEGDGPTGWMTRARMRRLAVAAILTYLFCAAAFILTAKDGVDALGIPLGFDFLAFHGAARLAAAGELAAAFDPAVFQAALEEQLPGVGPGYYWLYPPTFALIILPLSLLSYGPAFWLWTFAGLSAYGASVWLASRDRLAVLAALGFSATWVTAYHGQNAFFTAALFMLASHWLIARKDMHAGVAIGLLAIKPHLALLFPLALAASGRWPAFLAAAATAIGFTLISTAVLGAEYILAYLGESRALLSALMATERHWATISSIFIAVKLTGAPDSIAWTAHLTIALASASLVFIRFRQLGSIPETVALLAAATLLVSPYVMDYDLAILVVSGVVLFAPFAGGKPAKSGEAFAALAAAMIPICVVGLGRMGVQIGWAAPLIVVAIAELRLRELVGGYVPNRRAALGAK